MIKNLSTENGIVEIEEVKGTVVDVAADLACIINAIFTAMTEDDADSKEFVGKLFIEAVKLPFQDETNNQKKNQEEKSDDPTDAAFMAFLSMLMSDDKRPVS